MQTKTKDPDYLAIARRGFSEWDDLLGSTGRMQTDADLINQVPYILRDVSGHKIPNAISITLPDISEFVWKIETSLNSANEQIAVTSEDKKFDTKYVEDFLKEDFKQADKLLPLKDLYPLNPFVDQQTVRRGRAAAISTHHIKDGKLISDMVPLDTKYFRYWTDTDGIYMSAYKTSRSKDQILSQYKDAKVSEGVNIEVMNIWRREVNKVWAGGSLILEQPNPYGYVPTIYHKVPMGSMLLDPDTLKYQGESAIALIRNLYTELNRIVSIMQSLTSRELDHAMQVKVPKEMLAGFKVPGSDEVNDPARVNAVPDTGGYVLMPIGELRAYAQWLIEMIQSRMDKATKEDSRQSVLSPKTATEILQIAQSQGEIILPRLVTRQLLKQDLCDMAIKQTIQSCEKEGISTFKLGSRTWEVAKLKCEAGFEVEIKYSFSDPRLDAARQSLAASQRGLIPDKDIRRNTLLRDDPEGDERQLGWEEVERLSPLVKMYRRLRDLDGEAEKGTPGAEVEMKMLMLQLVPALRQAMQGMMTPNQPGEVTPSQPFMPVMPQSGQVAQGQ